MSPGRATAAGVVPRDPARRHERQARARPAPEHAPAGAGEPETEADAAEIHAEGVEEALRLSFTWVPFTPFGTLLVIWILGSSVPLWHRVLWMGVVWLAAGYLCLASWSHLRARRAGRPAGRGIGGLVGHALLGATWGSIALVAFPGPEHTDLRTVVILFASVTSMLATVASSSAGPSYFVALQLPLILPVGLVVGLTHDRLSRMLGIAIALYCVVIATVHRGLHRLNLSELRLKHSNAALVDSLVAEQDRTADANLRLSEANRRLGLQATHDPLTGLVNRTELRRALQRALSAGRRHDRPVAMLYFDLDHFKLVNDSLGHRAGDELLVAVARRLEPLLRPEDVLARLGGDEFTVLAAQIDDAVEAVQLAERLRDALRQPFAISGRRVAITASIGVATTVRGSERADDLIAQADAAQYRAKQGGRNRVEMFDRVLKATLQRRSSEEAALRSALTDGEIVPYFQPQLDLATGRAVGAEALARWQHPTRGVLDAGSFIGIAEECGLVEDIDVVVITNAVIGRRRLHEQGVDPGFRTWLNVSPRQLSRAAPTRDFMDLLDQHSADPAWFGIEITEQALLADSAIAATHLAELRALGVRIALDDFGTGYSSLTLLHELPLDEIKIDRSFVSRLLESASAHAIVTGMVDLARSLDLRVVAEGVETAAQADQLQAMGAHRAQGWLWAKALPLDELVTAGFAPIAGELRARPAAEPIPRSA